MACIVTDKVVSLSPTNTPIPTQNATVIVSPDTNPCFVKSGSVFYEYGDEGQPPHRNILTDQDGEWSVTLPWPTESSPSDLEWVIQLPDGSRWQGVVPEGIAGPVNLYTLKTTYSWVKL